MVSELRTEPGHRLGCDGSARYGGRVWKRASAPAEAARREAPRRSVAQLVRAPVSKTGGCGFESLHSCQTSCPIPRGGPVDKPVELR